jgi:DinB family protein
MRRIERTDSMSARAQELATRFTEANDAVLAVAEGCSPAQWLAHCVQENCTVAALTRHIAGAHRVIAGWTQTMANGEAPPPVTGETIDKSNAANNEKHAHADQAEALAALRRYGAAAAEMVRGLSDEQLARSEPAPNLGGAELTTAAFIENVLIGHPQTHLLSIRAAIRGV